MPRSRHTSERRRHVEENSPKSGPIFLGSAVLHPGCSTSGCRPTAAKRRGGFPRGPMCARIAFHCRSGFPSRFGANAIAARSRSYSAQRFTRQKRGEATSAGPTNHGRDGPCYFRTRLKPASPCGWAWAAVVREWASARNRAGPSWGRDPRSSPTGRFGSIGWPRSR